MKTVCFFGIYDPSYSRNRILMRGFSENGWRVLECRADPRAFRGVAKYFELVRQYRRIRREPVELVLVAYPAQPVALLARALFGWRIVLDAFTSLYDSNVSDRRVYAPWSAAAAKDWVLDWIAVHAAHTVLCDTEAHLEYFAHTYRLARERGVRVFIGTDPAIFYPRTSEARDAALVHFHGTFIPLQGIGTILDAAKHLPEARIRIVGRGQEYARMRERADELSLANVEFAPPVPLGDLPNAIAPAAVCLGIFGTSAKAARVIPNKVYEYLAMGKPVITADTPAIRELAAFGPLPLALVPAGDAAALAAALRALLADPAERDRLGRAARARAEALSPRAIVDRLVRALPPGAWRTP